MGVDGIQIRDPGLTALKLCNIYKDINTLQCRFILEHSRLISMIKLFGQLELICFVVFNIKGRRSNLLLCVAAIFVTENYSISQENCIIEGNFFQISTGFNLRKEYQI